MINYHITPKAPLIFRDGKPFGTEDNIADTLAFPLPSTLAGALRTAWAEHKQLDYSDPDDLKKIKKTVSGPLLTCTKNQKTSLLFPAPADSICLNDEQGNSKIHRLKPEHCDNSDEGTDLPANLSPVQLGVDSKGKPAKDAPHHWHYDRMLQWLQDDNSTDLVAEQQGVQNLPIETRTHVSITAETRTAKSGHLFQTAGLDFSRAQKNNSQEADRRHWGWDEAEYGIACAFQEELPDTLRNVGGEARLAAITKQHDLIPDCPIELSRSLANANHFRLILVTPAIFKKGYLPDWIDETTMTGNFCNMQLTLKAVSAPRWQAGTSWDMASSKSKTGSGMRNLKRLAPAGTVYWFEKTQGSFDAEGFWLSSISDEHIHRQDGFGLTLPGVWTPPQQLTRD